MQSYHRSPCTSFVCCFRDRILAIPSGWYHTVLKPFRSSFLITMALPALQCNVRAHFALWILLNTLTVYWLNFYPTFWYCRLVLDWAQYIFFDGRQNPHTCNLQCQFLHLFPPHCHHVLIPQLLEIIIAYCHVLEFSSLIFSTTIMYILF